MVLIVGKTGRIQREIHILTRQISLSWYCGNPLALMMALQIYACMETVADCSIYISLLPAFRLYHYRSCNIGCTGLIFC